MLKICGLIRQKLVKGKLTIIMQQYQWVSFKLEHELTNVELNTSKMCESLRSTFRKNILVDCIGKITNHSFKRASAQYNKDILPLIIKMFQLRRIFLLSISIDITE